MKNNELKRKTINAVMRRIRAQFPETPEAKLCCAIVEQAATDLMNKDYKSSAEEYLMNAKHAELCGVDTVWIKESFQKAGLFKSIN